MDIRLSKATLLIFSTAAMAIALSGCAGNVRWLAERQDSSILNPATVQQPRIKKHSSSPPRASLTTHPLINCGEIWNMTTQAALLGATKSIKHFFAFKNYLQKTQLLMKRQLNI
jgi:hypothetical protein